MDSPVNRETARLLAFLDEPEGASPDSPSTVRRLWPRFEGPDPRRVLPSRPQTRLDVGNESESLVVVSKGQRVGGGLQLPGLFWDMMIQEMTRSFDLKEKESYLAHGDQVLPFPTPSAGYSRTRSGFPAGLDSGPGQALPYRSRSQGAGMESDLRALIVERLGHSDRPEALTAPSGPIP